MNLGHPLQLPLAPEQAAVQHARVIPVQEEGLLGVVGIPLPFISYGGTAMVSQGLALGILMAITRRSRRLMQS